VIEGGVGGAALGGSGSETNSLEPTDGWEGIGGGSFPILSVKPESRGDVMGFVVYSGSSSTGKFAESNGSDGIVGATNARDSTGDWLSESSCKSWACVVVDTPPNPEVSYSNEGESRTADWCAKVDQGSGEPERGRAKGSSNGFSSRAREDCCRRSSKPDMMDQ
jgi:hypothetical protein